MVEVNAKGKIYSKSRWLLQRISDTLRTQYSSLTISSIQPANEGDYFIFINWFEEAA